MGGIKSRGIDKDEFVSVFFMVQDSICRDTVCAGFQTLGGSRFLARESINDLPN